MNLQKPQHLIKLVYRKELVRILLEESIKSGHSLLTVMLELIEAHDEFKNEKIEFKQPTSVPDLKAEESKLIISALKRNNWNQRKTAIELNIPKSTLFDKLKKLGVKLHESNT